MRVVSIRGFDDRCNMALNRSFETANEYLCEEATSAHMLYNLLKFTRVVREFKEDIGMDASDFSDNFISIMSKYKSERDPNDHVEVNIEEISDEFRQILQRAIHKSIQMGKEVDDITLYKCIIKDKRSDAWKMLELMGINKDSIDISAANPLEDMPITSQFGVDYNILAKEGRFDPIEAREDVIDRAFEVMGRRIKNNPCFVGESGVGKTAIVEGMAQRLVEDKVPNYLKGKHIISIDITSIVQGSKYRGDFEERLNGVLNEAASNSNIILFFDEMHMLAEAGGNSKESAMTASNILKPAISRGDVQIIGATTPKEYKKFIEQDSAFERRLQSVKVPEPSVDEAIRMVYAVIDRYNDFHNSTITDEALEAAVVLSDRYITDKKLPDKAITVIDETAARLKKKHNSIQKFDITLAEIKKTVSKTTGIDVEDLDETSKNKMQSLGDRLKSHVIGQDAAVMNVTKAIRRSKAGIKDPNRPIGSFLFVGPTGVGKTELTKAVAIEFGGGLKDLIRFDMSEFMEKHSVSKLIGAPPGYVGYGNGGQLTEAVRNNPYSIILFDEIEKAHPDVFNIMLQILDDGILTDSDGLKVDFKNTVLIMTSNAGYGAEQMHKSSIGFGRSEEVESNEDKQEKIAMKALESTFRPEFINRLDKIVVFNKLDKDSIFKITELLFKQLKTRLTQVGIEFTWEDSIIEYISSEGFSDKYGARNIKRKIQDILEDELADRIISGEARAGDTITVSYKDKLEIVVKHNISIDDLKKTQTIPGTDIAVDLLK